jgi:hypothetical protein
LTEQEWLTSDDPAAMLAWVAAQPADRAGTRTNHVVSDRKLRLFACAVSRRLSAFAGESVALVEAYADDPRRFQRQFLETQDLGYWCASDDPVEAAETLAQTTAGVREGAALLRDVVGDPFRPVPLPWAQDRPADGEPSPPYCPWLTPQVLTLARVAYEKRQVADECDEKGNWPGTTGSLDPLTLCALADALEEAGCDSEGLLRHLRGFRPCWGCHGDFAHPPRRHLSTLTGLCVQCPDDHGWELLPGPHVRGCWALDLVLGKE